MQCGLLCRTRPSIRSGGRGAPPSTGRPGDTSTRGPGAVQWLQSWSRRSFGRFPVSIEKILEGPHATSSATMYENGGEKRAAVAVSHSILAICWYLLSENCDYEDLGGSYFVQRDADHARQRAVSQLQALGYRVTLETTAA